MNNRIQKKPGACVKLHGSSSSVAVIHRRQERDNVQLLAEEETSHKRVMNTGAVAKSQWCMSHMVAGDWAAGVGQEVRGGSL